jgi:hypothetical protein
MWNTVVPGWLRTIFVGLGYRTDIVVAFPVAICCSTCRLRTIFTGMPHVMAHTLTRTSCNHANTCPYLRPRVERQPTTHVPSGPGVSDAFCFRTTLYIVLPTNLPAYVTVSISRS